MTCEARFGRPHREFTPAPEGLSRTTSTLPGASATVHALATLPFSRIRTLSQARVRLRALCAGCAHCRATLPRVQSVGSGAGPLALLFRCHLASDRRPGRGTKPSLPPALSRMPPSAGPNGTTRRWPSRRSLLGPAAIGGARTWPVLPGGFQKPCSARSPWGSSALGIPKF